ncbi:MAG: CPBP family intramembrane metalloprotease [Eubacteriales bacterium]|nr:CPBP family intramembrane metalloprotease [Eubacteriales bacterium]MDD3883116.1 CPBP family intramembrane metalloprotease [Eubacteriales bacterium]MDD4513314.1 CPBP family intramembrane metalloprotease [Eubacteriales bacterium]
MQHDPRVIFPPEELKRRNHISYLLTLLCAVAPLIVRLCWQPIVIWLLPRSFTAALADDSFYQAANGILEFIVFGLPAFLLYLLLKKKDALSVTAQPRFLPCVALLLLGVALAYELTLLTDLWYLIVKRLGLPDFTPAVRTPASDTGWLLLFLGSSFAAPVCEELLFRGAVFGHIRKYLPAKVAVPLCTLGFALMHGSLTGLPAHICVGLILTIIMLKSENILYTIMLHFSYNFTITGMARKYGAEAVTEAVPAEQYSFAQVFGMSLPTILMLGFFIAFLLYILLKSMPKLKESKPREITKPERALLIALCAVAPAVFLLSYFGVSL